MTIVREHHEADDAQAEFPSRHKRWYALILLTAIFAVHHIDRSVMSVIVEPVKREFQLSDTAMGMLTGFAHSVALSVLVLPLGWLADRVNRVRLLTACVAVWSLLTGLGAFASSYTALLLMRAGVGAAEAGAAPTSVSLIASIFPRREYPVAMGVYYSSVALGTGLIFLLGGYVAHHYGWRAVFVIAGLPGIVLAVLFFLTVREPSRRENGGGLPKLGPLEGLRAVTRNSAVVWIIAAGSIAAFAQNGIWVWMASFLMRVHDLNILQAGTIVGISAAGGKGIGSLIAGPLSNLLSGGQPRHLWRYSSAVLTLSVPIGWLMVTVPSLTAAVTMAMLLAVILGGWAGQGVAILVTAADDRSRGTAVASWQLAANLVGAALGPLLTGMLSDLLGGDKAVALAIGVTLTINLLAALCFWRACYWLPADRDPVTPA